MEKAALVFGQMDEPPACVCGWPSRPHHGRVLPRRDEPGRAVVRGQHLPLRPAGSEVSTLLGRMPSAVGYQPTLADEMGELQERSPRPVAVHHSVQAVYVPADDYTDPHLHTSPTSTHDELSARSPPRIYRGRPALVDVEHPRPEVVGTPTTGGRRCRASSSASASYRTSLRSSGSTSSAKRTASRSRVPARSSVLSSRSTSRGLTGLKGVTVPIDETVESFEALANGELDNVPEQAFLNVAAPSRSSRRHGPREGRQLMADAFGVES